MPCAAGELCHLPHLENEDDDDVEGVRTEPTSYAEVLQHFAALENYAEASGINEAGHLLQRARVLMIAEHASRPSRQTDVRGYFDT